MEDQPHYVRDYEAHVEGLSATLPRDEAMSAAVGGGFERVGPILRAIVEFAGLKPGMSLVDIGCGSGRLAAAVKDMDLDYLGLDVVQPLLDYAKELAPAYSFQRNTALTIPRPDASVDMCCAFSLFTHLRHEETYLYMQDARRALKPGGVLVLSFLEFGSPSHWPTFLATVEGRRHQSSIPLNAFTERTMWRRFADRLGYRADRFIDGAAPLWGEPLGQSVAIFTAI